MMKNGTIIPAILLLFTVCGNSFGQHTYTYRQPQELDDGWKTDHLVAQHMDTTRVYRLFEQLYNNKNKVHSVLLVVNNQIVIEEYLNGYSAGQQHDMRSVTKSVRSILMGIAIDKGFIDSVDDPIWKYLGDLIPTKHWDERKKKITIRNLLTMSGGLECDDWDKTSKGQEDKVHKKKDWIRYTVDLPMIHEPGEVSTYCSMGTVLIAEIIQRASGMTIDEFAQRYLFTPLGIVNVSWGHTSKKNVASSTRRLYMTPRDMAKIGQLVLNNGQWEGKQIVSEQWITESTAPHMTITGIDYGYLWWSIPFPSNNGTTRSKTATGNGGQYIMILPEVNMVAVFTGGAYNSPDDKIPFAIVRDVFIPMMPPKK